MNGQEFNAVAALIFAVIFALRIALPTRAQDAKTPYPIMAPLEQYLMERNAEIALARTAAPEDISRDATVLVMGRHGYETAVEGKSGFVCLVERGWTAPFREPRILEPQEPQSRLLQPGKRWVSSASHQNADGAGFGWCP